MYKGCFIWALVWALGVSSALADTSPSCQAFEAKMDTFYDYYQEGHYRESVEAAQKLLQYAEHQWGPVSTERVEALNKVIMGYNGTGQYEKVLPLFETTKELILQTTGKGNREYCILYNSIGYTYLQLGRLDKAKAIYQQGIQIEDQYWDRPHPLKVALFKNMGNVYKEESQIKKARKWYTKAMTVAEDGEILDSRNVQMNYFTALMKLGKTYERVGQADKAEEFYLKARRQFAHYLREDHGRYSKILLSLGKCYRELGKYEQARSTLAKALTHVQQHLGKKHPRYLKCLSALASYYQEQDKPQKAFSYFKQGNAAARALIRDKFAFLSEAGKTDFINELRPFFRQFNSFMAAYHQQYPELPRLAYNNALLIKGLVLRSMQNLRKANGKATKHEMTKAFDEWQSLHQAIGRQMALAPGKRDKPLDSLKQAANQLERKLVTYTGENHQAYLQTIAPEWEAVANPLNTKEAALEFVTYQANHEQQHPQRYGALILKGGEPGVTFVPLMATHALKKRLPNKGQNKRSRIDSLYQWQHHGSFLYHKFWKPIDEALKGIDKLYFSSVGDLHKLSFKAIPTGKHGHLLTHQCDLLRMNSTGDLTQPLAAHLEEVTMFGGIRYAYNRDTGGRPKRPDQTLALNDLNGYQESRSVKDHFNFLKGSSQEVEQIHQRLTAANVAVKLLEGHQASEDAFKALSGQSPEVLHLSTHGFCFPGQKPVNSDTNQVNVPFQSHGHPLLRSGLVMAGGNYAWKHGQNPYEQEDGILTAYEIAGLDLSQTDVVVLSACETGLGEIRGSEGVYGLQRAFRIAGVDYLIMSLWKVPDEQTRQLMEDFYANWTAGQSIRQAFRNAQQQLANKYPPYFWASFVLVGGWKEKEQEASLAAPPAYWWMGGMTLLALITGGMLIKLDQTKFL